MIVSRVWQACKHTNYNWIGMVFSICRNIRKLLCGWEGDLGGFVVGLDGLGPLAQLRAHGREAQVSEVSEDLVRTVQRDPLPPTWMCVPFTFQPPAFTDACYLLRTACLLQVSRTLQP